MDERDLHASRPLCRYNWVGVCVYKEIQNPGLELMHHCAVLAELADEWDDFLERAETFDLNEPEAARIWERRMDRRTAVFTRCPHGARNAAPQNSPAEIQTCRYRFGNACLLAMPVCAGRCERYSIRGKYSRIRPLRP